MFAFFRCKYSTSRENLQIYLHFRPACTIFAPIIISTTIMTKKILLLGSGELGKEFVIAAKRLDLEQELAVDIRSFL